MKTNLFRFLFDFLVIVLLTFSFVPSHLTNPEDEYAKGVQHFQSISSEYHPYYNLHKLGDYIVRCILEKFTFGNAKQYVLISSLFSDEQFIISKLLSYRLLSIPPPFLI